MTNPLQQHSHEQIAGLGRARVPVTRLGFGTTTLGGMYSPLAEEDADDVVRAAYEGGIRYFDTAPFYGHGVSERRLGRALRRAGATGITLSSKVGRVLEPGAAPDPGIYTDAGDEHPVFDFSRDGVLRSLEGTLTRLGVAQIDICFIHDPDDHEEQALREAYPALERLRDEGVVKAIGVGINHTRIPTRFANETGIDAVLIAGRFTLLDQSAQHDLLPAALRRGVSVVAAGVFNSGVLADPTENAHYDYERVPAAVLGRALRIREVLREYDVPLTAAAAQFPLRHPAVTTVLVGAWSRREITADIADFDRPVPAECWAALERAGLVEPVEA